MKTVLMYHSIDESGSVISLSPDVFRAHVRFLREREVPVMDLGRLIDPVVNAGVAITFDDGFQNFATHAWPVLKESGFGATVFVASDRVGKHNSWEDGNRTIPSLPLMSWDVLGDLAGQGVTIGSHSRTHADLTALNYEELTREVAGSRSHIEEKLGETPAAFAYPYGRLDRSVKAVVEDSGFEVGVTTRLGFVEKRDADRLGIPRVDAYYLQRTGTLERWGTAWFRAYIRFRALGRSVAARVRRTR